MHGDRRLRERDFPVRKLVLAWLAVSAILLLTSAGRLATGRLPDPDDALRLAQVRDLLAGQNWFDITQYRINAPSGTVMHWSRLVDLPLYLVVAALEPLFGRTGAERAALVVMPLLTLGVAAAAVGRHAWRLLGARVSIFSVLACGFLPSLLFQFQPQRIDHHGWQIASVAIALWGIGRRNSQTSGWIAGLAMAFGLSISLEILPVAALFAAVLFARWLSDRKQRYWLIAYMQGLCLSLLGFYLGTRGMALIEYCDAISPAHLAFFAVAAAGVWLVGGLNRLTGFGLVMALAVVGSLSLGSFALLSPDCLTTPFATLDPIVDRYWYRLVLEGQPLWMQPASTYVPALVQMAAAIGATLLLRVRSRDWMRNLWSEHLFLLLGSLALGLIVARSLAFAAIIAAMPLGWLAATLLDRLRERGHSLRSLAIAGVLVVLLAPMTLVLAARSLMPSPAVEGQRVADSQCDIYENAPLLTQLQRGTIFAPLDMGPAILLGTDHNVVATGHHRAADSMEDVIRAFTAQEAEALDILAARNVDYVALCTDMTEVAMYAGISPEGLAAQLRSGRTNGSLQQIDLGGPSQFTVYRVID